MNNIEVILYRPMNKNTLQGIFNIKIPKWGNFIIREISYFKKNGSRWISFPSRSYEKNGEKKYFHFMIFEEPHTMKAFQEKVFDALDAYLLAHPEALEAPKVAVFNEFEQIPF
jgi:hypothetical protein